MYSKRTSSAATLAPSFAEEQDAANQYAAPMTLPYLYEKIAAAQPERIAVVTEAGPSMERISYGELNARANRFARGLQAKVVRREPSGSYVAIYLDRSPEMLVAMLGTWKAGFAYLPIDATYPIARVMGMLEDARPVALVTSSMLANEVANELAALSIAVVTMDEPSAEMGSESGENLDVEIAATDLAYVMYTSGSTGKPKGVLVTHGNVARLLEQAQPWFNFGPKDVWTSFHSIAFDFSVWEIWGCLLTGGRLVVVSHAMSRSPREFRELLIAEQVTVLNQTPSAFLMLLGVEEGSAGSQLRGLRYVIFGGETLQYRALAPWFRRYADGGPSLVNMYGITETTVHVTYRVVTAADAETVQESLIGVPIADMQVYLLDEAGARVANGEVGELYVGGAGVSRGYLNRPELNAERFIADPFRAGGTLYRTGDVGRVRADGELVYLGRNDRQVKINGFRIELGEVEAAIAECPGVRQSCVIVHLDEDGGQRLAAYFATTEARPTAGTLSHFLAGRLPGHARPSFYVGLETFPLTANGKIDLALLPKPGVGRSGQGWSGQHKVAQAAPSLQGMEARITRLWCRMLGVAAVGPEENVFDIGGTSLQLIRAHDELESELGRRFSITWMFEYPTVRSLAVQLSADASAAAGANRFQEQARRQRNMFARATQAKRGVL